jgi:hypothetical protein
MAPVFSTFVELPERVFVLARVPEGGPSEERMVLFSIGDRAGSRRTPVFTSMSRVAAFLEAAQALGFHPRLDYVFPTSAERLALDLNEYTPVLDPEAADFFAGVPPILPA